MLMVGCFDKSPQVDKIIEYHNQELLPNMTHQERKMARQKCLRLKNSFFWNCTEYLGKTSDISNNERCSCKVMIAILHKYPNGCEMLYGKLL